MKMILLAVLFVPMSAYAFTPLPFMDCTNKVGADLAACYVDQNITAAWNLSQGDISDAVHRCTDMLSTKPFPLANKPDRVANEFVCIYAMAARGLIPGLGPVPMHQ